MSFSKGFLLVLDLEGGYQDNTLPGDRSPITYIYTLLDPRGGAIRYVGKADAPRDRLRRHIVEARNHGRSHLRAWVRQLLAARMRPILSVVEACSAERNVWTAREQFHIARLKELGCNLVNGTIGGDGGFIPEVHAKFVGERGSFYGRTHSQETRDKIGRAHLGRHWPAHVNRKKGRHIKRPWVKPTPFTSDQAIASNLERRQSDWQLISPDGDIFQVQNLVAFCHERNLTASAFYAVASGTRHHHKQWHAKRIERLDQCHS